MNKSDKRPYIKSTKRRIKQNSDTPACKRQKLHSIKKYVKTIDKKTNANCKLPKYMNNIYPTEKLLTSNDVNKGKEADDIEVFF